MKVFVSYNQADRPWAEWIGWQLEAAGYEAILQAWDFAPGSNFVLEMQRALAETERTVAVFSPSYLRAEFPAAEWAAAFAADPTGGGRRLVPVRVAPCRPDGLLGSIVYVDLVGLDEDAARSRLLAAIRNERSKPAAPPAFPTAEAAPRYPGTAEPLQDDPTIDCYRTWARECHQGGLSLIGVGGGDVRLRLEEVYVPCRIARRLEGQHRRGEPALERVGDELQLEEILALAGGSHAVLLGEPGAGKTTALLRLQHHCLTVGPESLGLESGTLPLFLPLQRLDREDLSASLGVVAGKYLEEASGGEIAVDLGEHLWRRGRLLLLLDGLDEIADDRKRGDAASYIGWQLGSPEGRRARAVVSCRYAGYGGRIVLGEGFLHLDVCPLDANQVRRLVERWFREAQRALPGYPEVEARRLAADLTAALGSEDFSSQQLKVLVSTPLLLTLLCVVVLRGGEMPRQRVDFYDQCLRVLLGRWRQAKGLEPLLDVATALAVLRPLAWKLHTRKRYDLSKAELVNHLRKRLRRLGKEESPFRTVDWFYRETGVLEEYAPKRFGFRHLGLQEYLAATHAASRSEDLLDDLAAAFGLRWWREVLLLFLGLPGHQLFRPLMERVLRTDALGLQADLLRECLSEAPEVDLDPFLRVLDESDDPVRQATVLRLLRGRCDEPLMERARRLASSSETDLAALARQAVEECGEPVAAAGRLNCDFFLVHHPADEELATQLTADLRKRGVQLFESADWESDLENILAETRAAAVLVGPSGGAPWNQENFEACLELFADEKRPLVPVLLPGVEEAPELPASLPWAPWVDYRAGAGAAACKALEHAALQPAAEISALLESRPACGEVLRELRTGMRFLWVPAGVFEMGGEDRYDGKPVHRVRVSPFWLGETLVTNRQYGVFLEETRRDEPSRWRDRRFSDPDQPVVGVSWYDAVTFCDWLSGLLGRNAGLPSEAQWEFAARSSDGRIYPWGDNEPDASRACFGNNQPTQVGSFPAGKSPFGNLDMAGNAWEWCLDIWDTGAYGKRTRREQLDPVVTKGDADVRVLRGGGWHGPAAYLRTPCRTRYVAVDRFDDLGFRVSAAASGAQVAS